LNFNRSFFIDGYDHTMCNKKYTVLKDASIVLKKSIKKIKVSFHFKKYMKKNKFNCEKK